MPLNSVVFWLVLALGVLLTGVSKAGFAGSLGVVTVPLLSLVMPLEKAAALMLPVLIAMDAKVIHYYYRQVQWRVLAAVVPAACVGIGMGSWAMGAMPPALLQAGLGLVCVVFALWHRLNTALGRLPGASWLWGSVAGFTSTLIHAGGPPISIYFAGQTMPKQQWLATAALFFGIINLLKVPPYFYLGLWDRTLLLLALAALPCAWLGVWLGRGMQTRFSDDKFISISRALVFLSGLLLLYKAAQTELSGTRWH